MTRKSGALLQKELEGAFRSAHERADKELAGFDRAFKIRDQMLSDRNSTTTAAAKKKSNRAR